MAWDKKVRVGKTERYTYGLSEWLNGEALLTAVVTIPSGQPELATLVADHSNTEIGVTATGLAEGTQILHIDYTTATRSDCVVKKIKVAAAC